MGEDQREIMGHLLQIETVVGVSGVFQPPPLELFQEESHPFESVATMAETAMTKKPEHALVDLHALR